MYKIETYKMESKTYQYRKVVKPLLERKRRARINKCLDELKDLMIDCMQQQNGDNNAARLEKADILELTVDYLKNMKKKRKPLAPIDLSSTILPSSNSFRSGYVYAANEVSRALATLPRVDINLGRNLMTHLGHRLNQIQDQQFRPISSPLNVSCESNKENHYQQNFNDYHKKQMMSPTSSGYGSDSEISSSSSSPTSFEHQLIENKNVWRPW